MSLARVKLDESTKLEFGVKITGANSRPSAKLVIDGPEFSISYPCTPVNEGVEVVIGKLKNLLPAGEYPVRMEIVIEDKVYTPFRDTIVLEPNVEVVTQPKSRPAQADRVKVENVVVKANRVVPESYDPRHVKIAKLIASTLKQPVRESASPSQIINEALVDTQSISRTTHKLLVDMLDAADQACIEYNKSLLPPVI